MIIKEIKRLGCIAAVAMGLLCAREFVYNANAETLVRGTVNPMRSASISVDLATPVKQVHAQEGQHVELGTSLLTFDCSQRHAQLDVLKANARAALIDWKNKRELLKNKGIDATAVKFSEANFAKARAQADALQKKLKKCHLTAPFAGRVDKVWIMPFETPRPYAPVVRIISDEHLELNMTVPAKWLRWIRVGEKFSFELDETGKSYAANIVSMGTSVDPVNQSIKVKAQFINKDNTILSGMRGTATFRQSDS